jgi:hypothetical protein
MIEKKTKMLIKWTQLTKYAIVYSCNRYKIVQNGIL